MELPHEMLHSHPWDCGIHEISATASCGETPAPLIVLPHHHTVSRRREEAAELIKAQGFPKGVFLASPLLLFHPRPPEPVYTFRAAKGQVYNLSLPLQIALISSEMHADSEVVPPALIPRQPHPSVIGEQLNCQALS